MKTKAVMMIILSAALAAPAFAQRQAPLPPYDERRGVEIAPRPGTDEGGQPSGERREEVRKKMEAFRIWRLTEEIKLDEKTAAKFIPVISALEQKRRDLNQDNQEALRELRVYLDSRAPDEKKLKAAIERLEKNHEQMVKLREKEYAAAREHLTIEQQARYVLFLREFQREMRGMIEGARGMGPGMMRGPGSGPGRGMGQGPGMRGGPPEDDTGEETPLMRRGR